MRSEVCILAGSSLRYLPYLELYRSILSDCERSYEVVYWDRHLEDEDQPGFARYPEAARGQGISLLPKYIGLRRFFLNYFRERQFKVFIVLGMQIGVLLSDFLRNKRYIVDIRDFSHEGNPVFRAIAAQVLSGASLVCVSSPGFRQWLPTSKGVVVSHNTAMSKTFQILDGELSRRRIISYIGEIRYAQPNRSFIELIARSPPWRLIYHGAGPELNELSGFAKSLNTDRIEFTGAFSPLEKAEMYRSTDFVLCLYGSDHTNVKTLLPNRLYEACSVGRPLIVSYGSFLADVVSEFELGVVLKDGEEESLCDSLEEFYLPFKFDAFLTGCRQFLRSVESDDLRFREEVSRVLLANL